MKSVFAIILAFSLLLGGVTAYAADVKRLLPTKTGESTPTTSQSAKTAQKKTASPTTKKNASTTKKSVSVNDKNNGTVDIEDDHDQRKWDVGASVKINDYYKAGSSYDQVLADVQALATPYGLTVTESGFIGNGSSNTAGNIRISMSNEGDWNLYIYAWRSDVSDTGLNKTMNVTLQVMKYFLGDENGANLWSLWDAIMTGQNPNPSDYDMTDSAANSNSGTLTFSDGTTVVYDAQNHQLVLTLA